MDCPLDCLPPTARLLAEIIGLPEAQRLIEALGGLTITFSKGQRRDGQARYAEVAEIVGEAGALLLAERLGGAPISIPRCTAAMRAARDDQMREQFDQLTRNVSARAAVAQLARTHRMTDRNVWRVLGSPAASGESEGQSSLF